MVFLIAFVEQARHLHQVGSLGADNKPYVSAQFLGVQYRSGTADEPRNPDFGHYLVEFDIGDPAGRDGEEVYFTLRHQGLTSDSTIGGLKVTVREFVEGFERRWFNVMRGDDIHGQLMLTGRVDAMAESYRRMLEDPTPTLWLHCHAARGLPDRTSVATQKPFVKGQVGGVVHKTGAAGNSETDPEWGAVLLRFQIGDGYDASMPVHLSVDASGTMTTHHLGTAQLTVGDFEPGFERRWVALSDGGELCISGRVNDFKKRKAEEEAAAAAAAAALAEEAAAEAAAEAQRVAAERRRVELEARQQAATQEELETLRVELARAREAEEARLAAEEARRAAAAEQAAARVSELEALRAAEVERMRKEQEAAAGAAAAAAAEAVRLQRELEEAQRVASQATAYAGADQVQESTFDVTGEGLIPDVMEQLDGHEFYIRSHSGHYLAGNETGAVGFTTADSRDMNRELVRFVFNVKLNCVALMFPVFNAFVGSSSAWDVHTGPAVTALEHWEVVLLDAATLKVALRSAPLGWHLRANPAGRWGVTDFKPNECVFTLEPASEGGFALNISAEVQRATLIRSYMLQWHNRKVFIKSHGHMQYLSGADSTVARLVELAGTRIESAQLRIRFDPAGYVLLEFMGDQGSFVGARRGRSTVLQVRRQTETEQWLILVVDGTQGMVRFVNRATKQYLGLVAGKLQLLNEPSTSPSTSTAPNTPTAGSSGAGAGAGAGPDAPPAPPADSKAAAPPSTAARKPPPVPPHRQPSHPDVWQICPADDFRPTWGAGIVRAPRNVGEAAAIAGAATREFARVTSVHAERAVAAASNLAKRLNVKFW